MTTNWKDVLDALEAEVEAASRAEGEATGEAPAFVPPPDLGPVPPALVERATSLLQRMYEVQEGLERRRAEVARELSAVSAARHTAPAARPVPHFLDTTA